jgi:uncharacterized protein (DUF342 family)
MMSDKAAAPTGAQSGELPDDLREMARDEGGRRVLILECTPDALSAYLTVQLKNDGETNRADVENFLEHAEITYGLDDEALTDVLARCAQGQSVERALIAVGEAAVDGQDAYVDFRKRPTGQRTPADPENAEKKSVDYKEMATFDNVKEGEIIGVFVPPQPGQGGTDVFGRVNPPREAHDLTVTTGENVEYDEGSREYVARCHGHVTFEKNLLNVEPVYRVRHSVDLSQGNIRFIGRVEIGEDVLDDFEVSGVEGVWVGGTAEACAIRSGNDVVIEGGVTGKEKGRIEARGGVSARYLSEVEVVAGDDVVVAKEIVNSKVFTLGRVIIERGSIVGGEVVALRGVVVRDVGSDLGVRTQITAGLDYHVAEKLYSINRDLQKLRERQQKLLDRLGPLLEKATKASIVDNTLRSHIEDLWPEVRSQQRQIQRLEKESGSITADFEDQAVSRVEVRGTIFSGAVLIAGRYERTVDSTVQGPVVVAADEAAGQTRMESLKGEGEILSRPPHEPAWIKELHG